MDLTSNIASAIVLGTSVERNDSGVRKEIEFERTCLSTFPVPQT